MTTLWHCETRRADKVLNVAVDRDAGNFEDFRASRGTELDRLFL